MKQFVLAFIALGLIILTSSSCTKCYTCTFQTGPQKLCPKDFPDGYAGEKLSVKAYEAQGYVCNAD